MSGNWGLKGKRNSRMRKLTVLIIAEFIAFYFGHTALDGTPYSGMCTSVNFTDQPELTAWSAQAFAGHTAVTSHHDAPKSFQFIWSA